MGPIKYRVLLAIAAVLTLVACASFGVFIVVDDGGTMYEYSVKTEQVNDNSLLEVNETIPIEDLSSDEQDMLYRAFKKTDHFLDGAQVIVETNEQVEYSEEWRLVSMDGVMFVMAIQEHDTYETFGLVSGTGLFVGIISMLISQSILLHGLDEREIYKRYN